MAHDQFGSGIALGYNEPKKPEAGQITLRGSEKEIKCYFMLVRIK